MVSVPLLQLHSQVTQDPDCYYIIVCVCVHISLPGTGPLLLLYYRVCLCVCVCAQPGNRILTYYYIMLYYCVCVAQPGDRKLIAHRALRRIRAIYSGTLHNATWDRERTVFFRTLLDAQLEDLKESLGKRPSHSGKSWKNSVRKYFRKLRSFLRKEGYSTCSWAVVLDGTRRILQQLYTEGMN
uniref:Uncharacterized protein n=1 Tax=Callorhinchus milii TaxID=7868 RepID=A0A4W3HT71_CALMI